MKAIDIPTRKFLPKERVRLTAGVDQAGIVKRFKARITAMSITGRAAVGFISEPSDAMSPR